MNARITKTTLLVLILNFLPGHLFSQVNILSASLNQFNITPKSLCEISVFNYNQETLVILEASLLSATNKPLLKIISRPFRIKKGLNESLANELQLDYVNYSGDPEASFIQTNHMLPSGNYLFCCNLRMVTKGDLGTAEYCQDLIGDEEKFLYLIYPPDHDTIETLNPLLIWNHGLDNNFSSNEESYRIVLAEISPEQSSQSGIEANVPLFYKNYLNSHQILYPFEAQPLQKGKRYAWIIQRIVRGSIVNSTEAWDFYIKADPPPVIHNYVIPKKSLDAGFYSLQSDELYFKFDDKYKGRALECRLSASGSPHDVKKPDAEATSGNALSASYKGSGIYMIDTGKLNLKKGSYILEIANSKEEKFYIKFYVDK